MSKRAKKEKRPVAKIDFKPYGAAIKAGRTKQKESRNKAADALFICNRQSRQRLDRHGTIVVGSCETFHHYNVQGVK